MSNKEIIQNLLYFGLFVVVILIIAAIALNLYLKNFKFNTKKSKLYGMLSQLDNKSIVAFSLVTINYLFLTWCAMMTVEMNPIYISIVISLTIISSILIKDYIKLPINLLVSAINCFALYIIHFVHIYLLGEVSVIFMRISIFFIVAFIFVYFTYNFINDVNDIVQKNKYIQKKKKKGSVKNEN